MKAYLTIGMLALMMRAKAQEQDSTYQKKQLSETDVQLVFSYYDQDGNNSAVTGGVGTEKLTVYAPGVNIKHTFNTYNTISLNTGVDVISSASTDNIDFIVSSASVLDTR